MARYIDEDDGAIIGDGSEMGEGIANRLEGRLIVEQKRDVGGAVPAQLRVGHRGVDVPRVGEHGLGQPGYGLVVGDADHQPVRVRHRRRVTDHG